MNTNTIRKVLATLVITIGFVPAMAFAISSTATINVAPFQKGYAYCTVQNVDDSDPLSVSTHHVLVHGFDVGGKLNGVAKLLKDYYFIGEFDIGYPSGPHEITFEVQSTKEGASITCQEGKGSGLAPYKEGEPPHAQKPSS